MGEQGLRVSHMPRSRRCKDTGEEAKVMGNGGSGLGLGLGGRMGDGIFIF
jgi:hypothetical protein